MKSKLKTAIEIFKWTMIYCAFIALGFILGMIYQQVLFTQEVGKALSYTNIQVNFNATEFTEQLEDKFIPAWKEAFNETLSNEITK